MPDSKELSQEKQDLINKYQEKKQARQRQDKQVTFGEQPVEPNQIFEQFKEMDSLPKV